MIPDDEICYRAVAGRDPRFDGWIYVGVTSTGIYCRPSCPAKTPQPANCRFFAAAGAAQQAGFRACRRCRPDVVPGSPLWNPRADVAARAMRLIADGMVDRDGVSGLAAAVGYSERQLNRLLIAEVGAGPLAIARAQRAQTARMLIENTDLRMADVAFAAGFASIRQFNDTVLQVYGRAPSTLRRTPSAGRATASARPPMITLRLPVRQPFAAGPLFDFLALRAIRGIELAQEDGRVRRFSRSCELPHGAGLVSLIMDERTGTLTAALRLDDLRDLAAAVSKIRRLLDLDADPVAIDSTLGGDPQLAAAVAALPGVRVPGVTSGDELAVRALIGQQISVAGAATTAASIVRQYGAVLPEQETAGDASREDPDRRPTRSEFDHRPASSDHDHRTGRRLDATQPTHLFPTAAALAAADPATLPMPRSRGRALVGMAAALAEGRIDLSAGADRAEARTRLLELPGIGPWTAGYIAMRGLGDPDVLLTEDLVIRRELERRDLDPGGHPEWAPWRSYATMRLWQTSHQEAAA
ncbi:helix-turn-helix domain-containing protein [Microlunatus elymi]|uniref:DNA-3-methyladenine glycosylase II n=1 Tax=Microlunatus elymi TaxID=2596828 RepID=A0A516Q5F7_9ACTN|nr:helix-turn-helix domain-containing protein [Microlunatus elymi]